MPRGPNDIVPINGTEELLVAIHGELVKLNKALAPAVTLSEPAPAPQPAAKKPAAKKAPAKRRTTRKKPA